MLAADLTTRSPPHLLSLRFGCMRPTSKGGSRPVGGARTVPNWNGSRVVANDVDGFGLGIAVGFSKGFSQVVTALVVG